MAETYRDLLVIICIGLLGWGVIRIERIYQYPFFMGSIFVSFILPQAFSLVSNPGAAVSQEALERVLLMSCLCAAACWLGYETKPNKKWLAKLNIVVDEKKLFIAAIALMLQGLFFSYLLSRTPIQRSEVNGNWTGPATIYLFLSQVINIAFSIFLLQALKKPKVINIILTLISGWPLLSSILLGRRQGTMTFVIIIGLALWLVRRSIPPRWLVITAIFLMIVIVPVLGALRGDFWSLLFSGNWQELIAATQQSFESQQKGDILELRNAALLMDASQRFDIHGYGTGWWDSIIFQYVPGQIVGFEFKKSLQFNWLTFDTLKDAYGYNVPTGTTPTGVGDSFVEFGYIGCLVFALIGYLFKHIWISAVYHKSIVSRFLYMGLVSPAMVGITHGIGRFWQEAIFQAIFATLVAYYSRARYKPYYINSKAENIGE